MKKLFITLFTIFSIGAATHAQITNMSDLQKRSGEVIKSATDTSAYKKWTTRGITGTNFAQAALKNWSGGGENSFALNTFLNGGVYYRKNRSAWDNDLALAYGSIYTSDYHWRKNTDNIGFTTKYGYAATQKLFYTVLGSFNSQFAKGYNYPNDKDYISKFMAPGYAIAAAGIDYRPVSYFSAFFSPVTGRFTFVLDDSLSHIGAFGVDIDKKFKAQIGAYARLTFNGNIMENVSLISTLDLFTAYDKSFGNVVVNWEVLIGMKINKYLTATLNTVLKYDDSIKYVSPGGEVHGPRIQFKEMFGLGFSYKFNH